jgi:endothelin-converting enzyme
VNLKIGYSTASPNVLDPKSINDWYRGMKISASHFSNMIEFNRFKYNLSWNDLLKPADLKRWPATMVSTDGGYDPLYNEITYPAGYMQLPGFAVGLPQYISYSGLGSTAGYDLLHSFDRNGSRYDASGHLTAGWDNSTLTAYEKKTTCFVDQYNKFSISGLAAGEVLKVNGTLTRDENVADAAGLTTAYVAWQKREQENPGLGLPGLEKYTNEQLFFLSYVTSSCGKRRTADQFKAMATEPHSPGKFRINGALANSGAFRKAFNCPVKTPTCELW